MAYSCHIDLSPTRCRSPIIGLNSIHQDTGHEWTHAGAPGGSNCSWIARKPDGTTLAFVFNTLPEDFGGFFADTIPQLQNLMNTTTEWPDIDHFT